MTTKLREFVAQREGEIRDQMKALKVELRELQTVKLALDAQGDTGQPPAAAPSGATIKDLARDVLSDAPNGHTANEILEAMLAKHGREVDRTSLSPQLSRLKDAGEVVLQGQKWFLTGLHKAWEERLLEQAAADIGEPFADEFEELLR